LHVGQIWRADGAGKILIQRILPNLEFGSHNAYVLYSIWRFVCFIGAMGLALAAPDSPDMPPRNDPVGEALRLARASALAWSGKSRFSFLRMKLYKSRTFSFNGRLST
jgi:hypothetical protein